MNCWKRMIDYSIRKTTETLTDVFKFYYGTSEIVKSFNQFAPNTGIVWINREKHLWRIANDVLFVDNSRIGRFYQSGKQVIFQATKGA